MNVAGTWSMLRRRVPPLSSFLVLVGTSFRPCWMLRNLRRLIWT